MNLKLIIFGTLYLGFEVINLGKKINRRIKINSGQIKIVKGLKVCRTTQAPKDKKEKKAS